MPRGSRPISYKHLLAALEGYIDSECWATVAKFVAEVLAEAGRGDLSETLLDAVERGDRETVKRLAEVAKWASRRKQRVFVPPR